MNATELFEDIETIPSAQITCGHSARSATEKIDADDLSVVCWMTVLGPESR